MCPDLFSMRLQGKASKEAQTDHFIDDFVHKNVVHDYDFEVTSLFECLQVDAILKRDLV